MKRLWLCLCLGAMVPTLGHAEPAAQVASATTEIDTLFAELGKSPGLYAKFTEQKQIALLAAPLKSDGTVHFDRSRGLARHTRAPSKQSVLITTKALSFWDGKKVESISLNSAAGVRAFVEAFRLFLAADRQGIEKNFELRFEGDPRERWSLRLTPRDASLKKMISTIELSGQKIELKTLVVKETNGDVTTTEFTAVDADKHYSERDAGLFQIPPKL